VSVTDYLSQYEKIKKNPSDSRLPSNSWFIEDSDILSLPRDDGDSRYPYGRGGFNFWAYSSGYMHANEGLFSPFLRSSEGQEPKICFFAGLKKNGKTVLLPLLAVPRLKDDMAERYTVFSKTHVTYVTLFDGMIFTLRVFISDKNDCYFTLNVSNNSNENKEFFISSFYNPFLLHDIAENGENRWFREVSVVQNGELPSFTAVTSENLSRTKQVFNLCVLNRGISLLEGAKLIKHEETTSRNAYVGGSRGSLHSPKALYDMTFGEEIHCTAFTEVGIAGDMITLALAPKSEARTDTVMAYTVHSEDESSLKTMLSDKKTAEEIDSLLNQMSQENKPRISLKFEGAKQDILPENIINPFLEHLQKQVEFCSLIKGYIQLSSGSLIGIRDVFQALEGYLIFNPDKSKEKMLEALSFTAPNGRCPRQYALPVHEGAAPAMDLRPFIDQGVWVISTIVNYLKYTDDFDFLNEQCGYYEIVDESRRQVKKSDISDSVLDHLLRITDYLVSNIDPKTGCVKVLFGDWNDALDGLGVSCDPSKQYGDGVSVMAALQVYQNLCEMAELLSVIDSKKYSEKIRELNELAHKTEQGLREHAVVKNERGEKRIVHGWGDGQSYHVGSFCDPDQKSRHSLASNAFWALSGLYSGDTSIKQTILDAVSSLDSKYGLKTFEPAFAPGTKRVGRIPKLPAGTAENGAPYVHASVFGVMALFAMGCPSLAWEQLFKSLPLTHRSLSVTPFVMPNSYGDNPEKNIDGQSMNDWQTGSSNVVFKLLVRYVAGFEPSYDGIFIGPASGLPYERFELRLKVKNNTNITLRYKNRCSGKRVFLVNGEEKQGFFDSERELDKFFIKTSELTKDTLIDVTD